MVLLGHSADDSPHVGAYMFGAASPSCLLVCPPCLRLLLCPLRCACPARSALLALPLLCLPCSLCPAAAVPLLCLPCSLCPAAAVPAACLSCCCLLPLSCQHTPMSSWPVILPISSSLCSTARLSPRISSRSRKLRPPTGSARAQERWIGIAAEAVDDKAMATSPSSEPRAHEGEGRGAGRPTAPARPARHHPSRTVRPTSSSGPARPPGCPAPAAVSGPARGGGWSQHGSRGRQHPGHTQRRCEERSRKHMER